MGPPPLLKQRHKHLCTRSREGRRARGDGLDLKDVRVGGGDEVREGHERLDVPDVSVETRSRCSNGHIIAHICGEMDVGDKQNIRGHQDRSMGDEGMG